MRDIGVVGLEYPNKRGEKKVEIRSLEGKGKKDRLDKLGGQSGKGSEQYSQKG